jgi:hypothetical protein
MDFDADQMTAADRPRQRLLISAAAVLLPVIALVGAAAWFVRSYVLPPTVSIESIEPRALLDRHAEPVAQPALQSPPAPETTGTAAAVTPSPPEPAVRYTNNTADIWAAVPIPGLPRSMERPAPEPEASEPLTGPVPLPPRRPSFTASRSVSSGDVPLPRPRPVSSN